MIKVQNLKPAQRERKNEEYFGNRVQRASAGDRTYDPSRVFISFEGETIIDDLNNRVQRPHTLLKPLVMEALKEAGIAVTKLRWSQKAGCRMCPCSPGFIIEGHCGKDFYITATNDDTEYGTRPGL